MTRPSHRVIQACAAALDRLPQLDGYEANIVLVNRSDPEAHIFVGGSDPRTLAEAMAQLIGNPDQVGIVNRNGVKMDV